MLQSTFSNRTMSELIIEWAMMKQFNHPIMALVLLCRLSGKQPRKPISLNSSSSSKSHTASQPPSQQQHHQLKTQSQVKGSPRKGPPCASTGNKDAHRDPKGHPTSGRPKSTQNPPPDAKEEDESDAEIMEADEVRTPGFVALIEKHTKWLAVHFHIIFLPS